MLGIDTTYETVRVMEDGSFYLKAMADIPFRIRTLDEKNNVVAIRVHGYGCAQMNGADVSVAHEDPELVPETKWPFAVTKSPVIIPVHITGTAMRK